MNTMFGAKENTKLIKVIYLVINKRFSYYMIIRMYSFNQLGVTLSTVYYWMKYLFLDVRVGVIQQDQDIAKRFYV